MGTISHHQAMARKSLNRADRAMAAHNPAEAASALRRAVTHTVTALAVHQGWRYDSRSRLEIVIHANVVGETLSRSHLKPSGRSTRSGPHAPRPRVFV